MRSKIIFRVTDPLPSYMQSTKHDYDKKVNDQEPNDISMT